MDINVRITFDASDKLTQMVFAIAAMVVPALEDTETESKPAPAPAPTRVQALGAKPSFDDDDIEYLRHRIRELEYVIELQRHRIEQLERGHSSARAN